MKLDRRIGCVQTDATLLFSQQHPTLLLFRDRRSVAQQCWIRLYSSSNIVGAKHTHTHCLQRLIGCILPTMHCRSQHCWELLHPFADHYQHARNNSQHCWHNNVGSCCVRLHAALKNTGCTLSIVRDGEFSSSKQVLENKAKQPRLAGCGKQSSATIREEREILWES